VRGDDAHPASKGYACEKAHRLDFYQNGPHRLTKPLRRRSDGSFEEIDWEIAIAEVAARFSAVRKEYGGDTIFYYGGGARVTISPLSTATQPAQPSAPYIARTRFPRRRRESSGSRQRWLGSIRELTSTTARSPFFLARTHGCPTASRKRGLR
jgi:hypothetical protein